MAPVGGSMLGAPDARCVGAVSRDDAARVLGMRRAVGTAVEDDHAWSVLVGCLAAEGLIADMPFALHDAES